MLSAQNKGMEQLKPVLQLLERHEKLLVIQFLATELAQQEEVLLVPNTSYPVWSPLEAYGASDVLLNLLASPQTGMQQ